MPSERDKAKRWRPRFSVRTLVILVTLVCCYAACWGPTKTRGVLEVPPEFLFGTGPPRPPRRSSGVAPLIVQTDYAGRECYYFWFFGYVAKLPCCRLRVY
jgi:hypothetical protein